MSSRAYAFLLPFEIHTASGWHRPVSGAFNDLRIDVYAPFQNADGLRIHRNLETRSLPYRPGAPKPGKRLPALNISGNPSWPGPFHLADALRLDIHQEGEPNSAIGESYGTDLLRWIRLLTRQWWVLRGASESLSALQYEFAVDPDGVAVGGELYGTKHLLPWLGTERLLDEELLATAVAALGAGWHVPQSVSTLLDSVFSANHQDKGQAVLLASIACEAVLSQEVQAAAARGRVERRVARKVLKIGDLRDRLVAAADVFGRSFTSEDPEAAASIGLLWIARHALAHGSFAAQERNAVLADQEVFAASLRGAYTLFTWLANFSHRDPHDPMQALTTPLVPPAR